MTNDDDTDNNNENHEIDYGVNVIDYESGANNNHGTGDITMISSDVLDSDGMVNEKHLEENPSYDTGKETFLIESDVDSRYINN